MSASTMSRPRMNRAIRHPEGLMISKGEWVAILATADLVKIDLLTLPRPLHRSAKDRKKTRTYFRSYFPEEWQAAVDKMERLQPILALCAAHWKAEHVLGDVLLRANNNKTEEGSNNIRNDSGNIQDDSDVEPSMSPTAISKKRRRPSSAIANSKRRKGEAKEDNQPDGTCSNHLLTPSISRQWIIQERGLSWPAPCTQRDL